MKLFLIISFLLGTSIFAKVEVNTRTQSVPLQGTHVQVGSITFRVFDNDFPDATPETPVFIRINFEENIRLSKTLVDPGSSSPSLAAPIYIPIMTQPGSAGKGLNIVAPADSVSIIDWRAGHQEIWVKIQRSTQSWLDNKGVLQPPSPEDTAAFTIGTSAFGLVSWDSDNKNLPFTTRDPALPTDETDYTLGEDLILCLDLSGSPIKAFDRIEFYTCAFTQDSNYGNFAPYYVEFAGLFFVGVTWNNNFRMEAESQLPEIFSVLASDQGWSTHSKDLVFHGEDFNDPDGLDPGILEAGAGLELELLESSYAFEEGGISFNETEIPAELVLLEPFSLRGRTLYRKAMLRWLEAAEMPANLKLHVSIIQDQLAIPQDLVVSWSFKLKDFELFSVPTCNQGFVLLAQGSLHLLQPSQLVDTEIVPHLTRENGGFDTHLVFSNATLLGQTVHLTSFDAQGTATNSLSLEVPAEQVLKFQTNDLLGPGEHAWLSLPLKGSVQVMAVYQASSPGSSSANIFSTKDVGKNYRIFPGDGIRTWDGLALVNGGTNPAIIQIIQKNFQGETLATHILNTASLGKSIYLLETDFSYTDQNYFDLISSEPIYLAALRGDRDLAYLWTTPSTLIGTE